jgi:hypothetical protein
VRQGYIRCIPARCSVFSLLHARGQNFIHLLVECHTTDMLYVHLNEVASAHVLVQRSSWVRAVRMSHRNTFSATFHISRMRGPPHVPSNRLYRKKSHVLPRPAVGDAARWRPTTDCRSSRTTTATFHMTNRYCKHPIKGSALWHKLKGPKLLLCDCMQQSRSHCIKS